MIGTPKIFLFASIFIFASQLYLFPEKGFSQKDFTSPNIVHLDEIDELYKSGNFIQAAQKCHILIKEHTNEAVSGPAWNSTLGLEALNRLLTMFRKEIRKSEDPQTRLWQDQLVENLEQVLGETKVAIIVARATLELGKIRLEQGSLLASEIKFKEVVENYPSASVLGSRDAIICYSCEALDYLTDNFLIGRWSYDSAKTYLEKVVSQTPDSLLSHFAKFCLAQLSDQGPAPLEEVIRRYQEVPDFWFSSPRYPNGFNSRQAANRAIELEILFYGKEVKAKINPQVSVAYTYSGKRPIFDLRQGETINILYSNSEKEGLVWFKVKNKEGRIGWVLVTDVEP